MDTYAGYHQYRFPNSNGYSLFEVFSKRDQWYYSAVDRCCGHVGFSEGPFNTAREAYLDATGQTTRCAISITSRDDN